MPKSLTVLIRPEYISAELLLRSVCLFNMCALLECYRFPGYSILVILTSWVSLRVFILVWNPPKEFLL